MRTPRFTPANRHREKKRLLRIYHLTRAENAAKIMTDGFVDSTNHEEQTGVWFSVPAGSALTNAQGHAGAVVSLEFPGDALERYERELYPGDQKAWVLRMFGAQAPDFREFCIPAAVVNQYRGTLEQTPLEDNRAGQ
jgi:hypothetical protein